MKRILCLVACALGFGLGRAAEAGSSISLFDGRSFAGWNGDTNHTWRVENGSLVAGSLTSTVPRNEFLASDRIFTNFVLRLEFRLRGTEGFVNSGVQIRSERAKDPANEMVGYQLDIGDPTWWGSIYDETRRNKVMAQSDMKALEPALKRQDWNKYVIRAEGPRIRAWINEVQTVDYVENDASIVQHGRIGFQIHGGGKAEIAFKNITLDPLP